MSEDHDVELGGDLARAEQLIDLGRGDEALRTLRPALARAPGDARPLVLAAAAHHQAGRADEQEDFARRALALDPGYEWAWRLLADALLEQGRHAEAVQAAQEAVRTYPFAWQSHHQLSVALTRSGRPSEGWDAARRAVELAPNSPDTHVSMAIAALGAGDRATAQRAIDHALQLDPVHPGALNERARLKLLGRRPLGAVQGFRDASRVDPQGVATGNLELALGNLLRFGHWGVLLVMLAVLALSTGGRPVDPSHPGSGHASIPLAVAASALPVVCVALVALWLRRTFRRSAWPVVRGWLRRDRMGAIWLVVLLVVLLVVAVVPWLSPDAQHDLLRSMRLAMLAAVVLSWVRVKKHR